jgi:WD40 repeat protein
MGGAFTVWAQMGADIVWTTNAHASTVTSIGFAGNSGSLVSASLDRAIKLWNPTNIAVIRSFSLSSAAPLSASLSSDGALVMAGDGDGKTRIWRSADGVRLWFGDGDEEQVHSVCFSPDAARWAMARSDGFYVCCGILYDQLPEGQVFDARFSPDGQSVAAAGENFHASLWQVNNGAFVQDFVGHSNKVNSVDFSPDGTLLATASADGTARIWNVTNGTNLLVIDGGGGVAKFSANGKLLYTLDNYTFKVWRVSNGSCAGSIVNSGAIKFDIAKDGKHLAYGTESGAVVLARTPLVIDELSRSGNQTILKWQGGSGLYQLQSSATFGNAWQNVGTATTNTTATNINSSTLFFRVQSLPNP